MTDTERLDWLAKNVTAVERVRDMSDPLGHWRIHWNKEPYGYGYFEDLRLSLRESIDKTIELEAIRNK